MVGKADSSGKVFFNQVPLGFYIIEVQGSHHFLSSSRDINIVNDEDKDEVTIFVALKPRTDSKIEFAISSKQASGQHSRMDPSKTIVKAVLLPSSTGIDQSELEEYEFEALHDKDKGTWVAELPNGDYIINVQA